MNNNNIENKADIIEKLQDIEQRAIDKYLDYADMSDILKDNLDDEDLTEYNELHIKFYKTCFNCGDNLSCRYCEDIVKGEQTNESLE